MFETIEKLTKQVILVRTDLLQSSGDPATCGKLMAQVGHASVNSFKKVDKLNSIEKNDILKNWEATGETKICLQVTAKEYYLIATILSTSGIPHHVVLDNASTQFDTETHTTIGIGPWWADEINQITRHLDLY